MISFVARGFCSGILKGICPRRLVTKSTVEELLRKSQVVVIISRSNSVGVVMRALCYIFGRASAVAGRK